MRQKPHRFSVGIYSELQSRHILGLSLDQSNVHINLQPCENYIWWFSFTFINLMVASSTILKLLYAGGFSELLCIGGNGKYKNASEHEKPNCVAEPGVT